MSRAFLLCLLATLGFAAARFVLPAHGLNPADTFKDLAHVFVGGLFGAGLYGRDRRYVALATALTAVEVAAALVR